MIIERFLNWIRRLFGLYKPDDDINYEFEELPPHVKEFMKKDLREP